MHFYQLAKKKKPILNNLLMIKISDLLLSNFVNELVKISKSQERVIRITKVINVSKVVDVASYLVQLIE